MRERRDRFHGPYQHRNQWRVLVVSADGTRGYRYFATEREGEAYVRSAKLLVENRTVGSEVSAYLEGLREAGGHRPSTIKTIECRLLSFLRLREHDMPLSELTAATAAKLYDRRTKQCKPDTHRGELVTASQFCERHLVAKGLIPSNPFAGVKPKGTVSAGKQGLYTDEAAIFLRAALADQTPDGLACAVVLIFGLRASELANLTCGDLDAGGTILRVRRGKTRNAVRALAVPPGELRERLISLRSTRSPVEQLFVGMTRFRLHYQVTRLCGVAGVTKVCPHGLRGTAITAVASGSLVTAQMFAGHNVGASVTERHYIAPGTLESSEAARRMSSLTEIGEQSGSPGNEWATDAMNPFPNDMRKTDDSLN